jgi:hypothetical protein
MDCLASYAALPGSERLRRIEQKISRPSSRFFVIIADARMPAESDPKFDIGHILFVDIVGYSKLSIDEQNRLLRELNKIVQGTEQFRRAEVENKLIRLPTGDGMALVFRDSLESPARNVLEIDRALRNHPRLQVRMGIYSGPVNEVSDVNSKRTLPTPVSTCPTGDGLRRRRPHFAFRAVMSQRPQPISQKHLLPQREQITPQGCWNWIGTYNRTIRPYCSQVLRRPRCSAAVRAQRAFCVWNGRNNWAALSIL